MLFGAPRRRHRTHHRRRNFRRRRNPGITSGIRELTSGSMLEMVGGAAAGFFGARMLPQNLPFLASYNSGITGYLLNAGSGLAISALLGKVVSKRAGVGALVGTGVAIIARIITDTMGAATPSTTAGASAAASGMGADLDFDLGYYIDTFPFFQGAGAGPYGTFVGNPYNGVPLANTSASAVRAGQMAAQAALPAGVATQPGATASVDRWSDSRW
jgi:hypothetical protein